MSRINTKISALAIVASFVIAECFSLTSPFPSQVVDWLNNEKLSSLPVQLPKEFLQPNDVLEVKLGKQSLLLHIIPTPAKQEHSAPPHFNKHITDSLLKSCTPTANATRNNATNLPHKIIHLHQDVWLNKNAIVRCRLLAQLGRSKRIFARKTLSQRINASLAMDFLNEHHLWGATKAKYYYGLFEKSSEPEQHGDLVAVATFSSRRKIQRDGKTHRSHELLRFCASKDANVVGGISKLIKKFTTEQQPDDIVTVVDRDWGAGSGWHSIGFETVATMPPFVMVVNPNEPGVRRHLVGAGINKNNTDTVNRDRLGLPENMIEKLELINSAEESLQLLASHSYFAVYDTGVERLIKIVDKPNDIASSTMSGKKLWRLSKPTYASSYYSGSSGIAALLRYAESDLPPPLDSEKDRALTESWRATSGTSNSAKLIFAAPSSLDTNATVEVRERANGWRTIGIVGGAKKSIYHAIYKVDSNGWVEPGAVVSENLKTMAALALAVLVKKDENDNHAMRFLHYGFGAGALMRLLAHYVKESQHLAIELDDGVVAASKKCFAPSNHNIRVQAGDALTYRRSKTEKPFDCIYVDVFDGNNLLPDKFYSADFLVHLRDTILAPQGIVIHNFHSGGKKHAQQIEEATVAYSSLFPYCCWLDSLDSKPNAGNAILLASKFDLEKHNEGGKLLTESAVFAQKKWGLPFDIYARVNGATGKHSPTTRPF